MDLVQRILGLKKDNSFFDFASNQPALENEICENSSNPSKKDNNDPINDPIATIIVAGS